MSNDLISRSAVIAIIQKEIERTASYAEHDTQINIMYGAEVLPAAYDLDKFLEKLEEQRESAEQCRIMHLDDVSYGKMLAYQWVIENIKSALKQKRMVD